jgi:hypothetical protein
MKTWSMLTASHEACVLIRAIFGELTRVFEIKHAWRFSGNARRAG